MAPVSQAQNKSALLEPCFDVNDAFFNVTDCLQRNENISGYQQIGTQWNNITNNSTSILFNATNDNTYNYTDEQLRKLNEFHIIKAVVLTAVTVVIMISICKMMFGMILKYPGKTDN